EDVLADERLVRLTRERLNEVAENQVAGIRVIEALTWLRFEWALHQFLDESRDGAIRAFNNWLPAGLRGLQAGKSGCVRQQVKQGDLIPCRRRLGQIRLDGFVDLQPAALLEQQDRGRGELFGNRRDLEPRARAAWDIPLDIRQPVPFADDDVAAAGDEHGTSKGRFVDIRPHDLIHPPDVLRQADGGSTKGSQEDNGDPLHVMLLKGRESLRPRISRSVPRILSTI